MGFFDIFKKKPTPAVTTPEEGANVEQTAEPSAEEQAQQAVEQQELSAGLEKTKSGFFSKLARAVAGRSTIDMDVLDDLEEVLITSDVGVETTVKIIERIEARVARDKYLGTAELQEMLREEIVALMDEAHATEGNFGLDAKPGEPYVVMVVGVNGAGKTTTIGKLAAQLKKAGKKVWIGAADTFRAAAIDQLQVWADRSGATMIRQEMGSDPASVAYDTLQSAKANGADVVLIDTAGRLHIDQTLMDELVAIRDTVEPAEIMLVEKESGKILINGKKHFNSGIFTGFQSDKILAGGITVHFGGAVGVDCAAAMTDAGVAESLGNTANLAVVPCVNNGINDNRNCKSSILFSSQNFCIFVNIAPCNSTDSHTGSVKSQ